MQIWGPVMYQFPVHFISEIFNSTYISIILTILIIVIILVFWLFWLFSFSFIYKRIRFSLVFFFSFPVHTTYGTQSLTAQCVRKMLSNFHHGTNHSSGYGSAGNASNVNLRPIQYLPYNSFYQHSFPPPIKHDLLSLQHSHQHQHPHPHPLPLPQSQSIRKISINEINVFRKPEKRKRKKFNEVERFYSCNYHNCNKSYGTLNHLNSHIFLQNHGKKRLPQEFKEIRLKLKQKRKLEREKDREKERSRQDQPEQEGHHLSQKQEEKDGDILAVGIGSDEASVNMNNGIDAGNKILNPPPVYNAYYNNNGINTTNRTNSSSSNTTTSTSTTTSTIANHNNNNYFTHAPAHYTNYPEYTNYINYTNSLYSPRNTPLSNLNANSNYAFNLNNYKI